MHINYVVIPCDDALIEEERKKALIFFHTVIIIIQYTLHLVCVSF